VFRPRGCDRCGSTGYRGRNGIFEIIEMSGKVRDLIAENTDSNVIQRAAGEAGMTTMIDDAIAKCRDGTTSVDEVLRVTTVGV
jgi:general secretion pathway protein E